MINIKDGRLVDLMMTETGEPVIGADGDFMFSDGSDAILSNLMFRLKTVKGDFLLAPQCGASLEAAIGEPNSEDTGNLLSSLAANSLTYDGFLFDREFDITVIPLNLNEIALFITAQVAGEEATVAVSVDLKEGQLKTFAV